MPLLLLISFSSYAQDRVVTGRVTDPGGNGIPGASITVVGATNVGTTSGVNGAFNLNVPGNATTLLVTSIGYQTQEVPIAGNVVVILQTAANSLNEVVVVGYGTRQRRDLTGSVTTINSREFNRGQITTPEQLIAGKVAGVQITSNGGAPGAGSTIRIRGGASLSASNDPLIVIDGVPVETGGVAGARNVLALINPN
ncbi:MAG TPA: carboxypeptidase-like regulatory domain-containing protein, partial [Flavisolibacter sp.]|nr:carboxypeptidase-like regulatory domain-containing protein [Flavisolibacter sp.]